MWEVCVHAHLIHDTSCSRGVGREEDLPHDERFDELPDDGSGPGSRLQRPEDSGAIRICRAEVCACEKVCMRGSGLVCVRKVCVEDRSGIQTAGSGRSQSSQSLQGKSACV